MVGRPAAGADDVGRLDRLPADLADRRPGIDGIGGADLDVARGYGQYFPYVVRDVYGWKVLPENLGNYQPVAYNAGVPVVLAGDLVRFARANRVVRDGFASFFFHPFFDVEILDF